MSAAQYEEILDSLMEGHPVCIVDLSNASADIRRAVLARSHKIFVVTQGTVQSLRSARMLLNEVTQMRGGQDHTQSVSLILNMKGAFGDQEISKPEAEKALGHEINHSFDFQVKGFPALELEGKKPFSNTISRAIGEELLKSLGGVLKKEPLDKNDSPQGKGGGTLLGGFLSKLKK